ncbi:MAG: ABC transporter ATP-binding protein [Clostridia bacterium]|nr:ABC transporter ATP-binding protein [Clostridia bacterium]
MAPYRRYRDFDRDKKVPVVKNVLYALKLVWQTDKRLVISLFVNMSADMIFSVFLQNILFLKVLLGIIDSKGDFSEFVKNLILFLVLSVATKGINWYANYVKQVSTKAVLKGLNNKVFDKAVKLDVSCYEDPEFYDKYQRATQILAWGMFDSVCANVASICAAIISLILVIGTVTAIDPAYIIFLLPVALVFAVEMFKSKLVYKRDKEMTTNDRIKAYVQRTVFLKDYSKDMRTSNIFAVLMERFSAAIASNVEILKRYGVRLFLYSCLSSLFSDFIPTIGTYALAGYQFIYTDKMTVSSFSVVLSSINAVQHAAMQVAQSFEMLSRGAFYFQNLRDFFDYEAQVVSGKEECGEFESLEFRNVSFRYPSANKNSITNLSFRIDKGETVALVGVNGAGKSTIVKLMLRFYDVTEGEILYNGRNIKEYSLESLRTSYGAVFQDYRNFAVSVFENVLCHECTDEEKQAAQAALAQVGIWDKISALEKGGDTVLTREFESDGIGLSGGENQKVSTARLFAKDFQFAVLDEPSSALDPIAEYNMYQNLIEVTRGKTVMYISHRLSSAVLSDKIIVIGGGELIETGSHAELMAKGGEYCRMFTLQSSSYNQGGEVKRNEE